MIYFARAGENGPIKIGFTAGSVEERIAAIQPGNHLTLRVVRAIHGSRSAEAWLHRRYRTLRIEREWYRFDEEMLSVVPPEFVSTQPGLSIGRETVEKVAAVAGGANRLAATLGVTVQAVSQWRRIPAQRVLAVEAITGVPRHVLRPDLYDTPDLYPRESAA